jgi:hypothetical protein
MQYIPSKLVEIEAFIAACNEISDGEIFFLAIEQIRPSFLEALAVLTRENRGKWRDVLDAMLDIDACMVDAIGGETWTDNRDMIVKEIGLLRIKLLAILCGNV